MASRGFRVYGFGLQAVCWGSGYGMQGVNLGSRAAEYKRHVNHGSPRRKKIWVVYRSMMALLQRDYTGILFIMIWTST